MNCTEIKNKGYIICGYQGIGKSTLCNREDNSLFVDLESSNFSHFSSSNYNWEEQYMKVAVSIASQNFIVFTSSHRQVIWYLLHHAFCKDIKVILCYPDKSLKDQWIDKLKCRYESSGSDKDMRTYLNAFCSFDSSIEMLDAYKGADRIVIDSMDYDLEHLILMTL